jgi:hypothetical protein
LDADAYEEKRGELHDHDHSRRAERVAEAVGKTVAKKNADREEKGSDEPLATLNEIAVPESFAASGRGDPPAQQDATTNKSASKTRTADLSPI